MTLRTRGGVLVVLTVAAMLLFAAVFRPAADAKPVKGKAAATTTLTFLTVSSMTKPLQNMITGFEKANPDISVKPSYVATSGIVATQLATQINSGNPPDISFVTPGTLGTAGIDNLAKAGKVVDLSKERWVKGLPKGLRDVASSRGKVYALPMTSYLFGMEYSAKLFADAKAKVPRSMPELLKLCRTFSSRGVTPITMGPVDPNTGLTAIWSIAAAYVYAKYPNWNTLRARKKVTFAKSKEWRAAYNSLLRMKSAGCFSPGVAGTTQTQALAEFASGKAAMHLWVNFILTQQRATAPDLRLSFFPTPGPTKKLLPQPFGTSQFSITSTKNLAAAKAFLAYLAQPANNNGWNKISGGLSNTGLAKGKLPAGNEAAQKAVKKGVFSFAYADWPNPVLATYAGTSVQALLTGQRTVSGILSAMDYLWNNPSATKPARKLSEQEKGGADPAPPKEVVRMDSGMEARLQRLLDQQEIHDKLMTYCRGVDRSDPALISQAYHRDAVANHGYVTFTGENVGAEITRLDAAESTSHMIGNLLIEVDGDEAVSESYVLNTSENERDGEPVLFMKSHRFVDYWERRDGEWGIVYRESVDSWNRILPVSEKWPGADLVTRARSGDGSDPIFNIREMAARQKENPLERIGSDALIERFQESGYTLDD